MTKVLKRVSKTQSSGVKVFEGSLEECGEWIRSEKEKIIDSFLEHRYNAVVSASQCFAVVKEKVTQDMLESEALKDYLRIYFTDYFMIVD